MHKQLFTILICYLKKTEVIYNKSRLKLLLASHPENNSLYAMVDALDELNIENIVLRLSIDNLQANGFPAIVHTKEGDGETFVVFEEIIDDKVYYYNSKNERICIPLKKFADEWSGIALYVSQNEIQAELELTKSLSKACMVRRRAVLAILAGLTCMALWSFTVTWSITLCCLVSLCIAGLAVSILLNMHDFGESNRLLHKVCHLNRATNCNAVLMSPASKLFGWLSMSDIGLCYFTGSMLTLIFAGVAKKIDLIIPWLFVLALCSFPYTIFSLSYQKFKVTKWCPLCLGIISVLWAEITLAIINRSVFMFIDLSADLFFLFFACFTVPAIAWSYVKPLWKEYNRIQNYEYLYLSLKRTPDVIRAMLANGSEYNMHYQDNEIHLGKMNAPIHFTIIMNFNCKPCLEEWNVLKRLLTAYPDSLWVTLRFFGYNAPNTPFKELIDALTEICIKSGNEAFCIALSDWYEYNDFQKWKAKHLSDAPIEPKASSSKNAQWIKSSYINHTPTIFVGNRKTLLSLEDLENLLKEKSHLNI